MKCVAGRGLHLADVKAALSDGVCAPPATLRVRWTRFAPRLRHPVDATQGGMLCIFPKIGAPRAARVGRNRRDGRGQRLGIGTPRWTQQGGSAVHFPQNGQPENRESWQKPMRWTRPAPRHRHPQVKSTRGECCAFCTKQAPRRPRELAATGTMDEVSTSASALPREQTGGKAGHRAQNRRPKNHKSWLNQATRQKAARSVWPGMKRPGAQSPMRAEKGSCAGENGSNPVNARGSNQAREFHAPSLEKVQAERASNVGEGCSCARVQAGSAWVWAPVPGGPPKQRGNAILERRRELQLCAGPGRQRVSVSARARGAVQAK